MPKTKTHDAWRPDTYDRHHSYVTENGAAVLEMLAAKKNERILDLGCGTGHLSARLAQMAGEVVGVDSSPAMIAAARAAHPGIQFLEADANALAFDIPFDAVFSNAALHWMQPPEFVAAQVAGVLKKGGRFVAEMGGKGNVDAITWGLYLAFEANGLEAPVDKNPWYFPSIAAYGAILERCGVELRQASLFDRPVALDAGLGLRDWLTTFGAPFFEGVNPKQREAILTYAEFVLRDSLYIQEHWYIDYRRLRFSAVKVS